MKNYFIQILSRFYSDLIWKKSGYDLEKNLDKIWIKSEYFRYLVGHYRNHHGGLPPGMEDREQFICEQCSQVFLSENSLHNHISNKHIKGPQKMHCEQCNQDFKAPRWFSVTKF